MREEKAASYVFVSFSSKNEENAQELCSVLNANGIQWWKAPECIPPGGNYASCIPEAIGNCTAFILLLSEDSQKSIWVPKELDMALNFGKPILPFHIDNVPLHREYDFRLSNIQRIEAYNRKSSAYNELLAYLHGLMPSAASLNAAAESVDKGISNGPQEGSSQNVRKKSGKKVGIAAALAVMMVIAAGAFFIHRSHDRDVVNAHMEILSATDAETVLERFMESWHKGIVAEMAKYVLPEWSKTTAGGQPAVQLFWLFANRELNSWQQISPVVEMEPGRSWEVQIRAELGSNEIKTYQYTIAVKVEDGACYVDPDFVNSEAEVSTEDAVSEPSDDDAANSVENEVEASDMTVHETVDTEPAGSSEDHTGREEQKWRV